MIPSWTREGDKVRCRHSKLFDPSLESCLECDSDPPVVADPTDDPLPEPPPGCLTSAQIEAWFVSLARAAKREARKCAADEIAKHRDTAIKAMRAATQLALRREDEEIVSAREKRILDRARKSH